MSLGVCRSCVCVCSALACHCWLFFVFILVVLDALFHSLSLSHSLCVCASVLPPFKMWNFICILITSSNVLKIICIYLFLNSFRSLPLTHSLNTCSLSLAYSVACLHAYSLARWCVSFMVLLFSFILGCRFPLCSTV